MGYNDLIPALSLSAAYNSKTQTLTLSAQGETQPRTTNIRFERQVWLGGLKFNLEGAVFAVMGPQQPYTHDEDFKINLPSPALPGNKLIIVTSNYPKGQIVPITGLPSQDEPEANTSSIAPLDVPIIRPPIPLYILYKIPFQIRHPIARWDLVSVDIKFDSNYLQLVNACVDRGAMVWEFNPIQMGATTATVTDNYNLPPPAPGHLPIIMSPQMTTYQLEISLPTIGLPVGLLPSQTGKGVEIPRYSFRMCVNIAMDKICQQYPAAKLLFVTATRPDLQPSSNVWDFSKLTVTARLEGDGPQGTAVVGSLGLGIFGPVKFKAGILVGSADVAWPDEKLIDLENADAGLKKAGFTGKYNEVTLHKPLYPGVESPRYLFDMAQPEESVDIDGYTGTLVKPQ